MIASFPAIPPERAEQLVWLHRQVDPFDAAFIAALAANSQRPRIEDFVRDVSERQRALLLQELLIVELECRQSAGETATMNEYLERFPNDAQTVKSVFAKELDSTIAGAADPGQATIGRWSGGRAAGNWSRFHKLRGLAEGGLGVVSVARDAELGRDVAFKELQPRCMDDSASRRRFMREAELTGRLEHPGIVPVYSLGQDIQGRPYYAMRLIEGESLSAAIESYRAAGRAPLRLRQLLSHVLTACQAISYAHSKGIIHRDLKPSNIMVGKYGETLVVDWGLAKELSATEVPKGQRSETSTVSLSGEPPPPDDSGFSPMTQEGVAMGTPAYMSPEQAAGNLDEVGFAADVYSLGATLFHVLTCQPPRAGSQNQAEAMKRALVPRITIPFPPKKVFFQLCQSAWLMMANRLSQGLMRTLTSPTKPRKSHVGQGSQDRVDYRDAGRVKRIVAGPHVGPSHRDSSQYHSASV